MQIDTLYHLNTLKEIFSCLSKEMYLINSERSSFFIKWHKRELSVGLSDVQKICFILTDDGNIIKTV